MGMKYFQIILFTIFASQSVDAGTPAEAEAIVQEHKTLMDAWRTDLASAQSVEMMNAILYKKPNIRNYQKRMIKVVGAELKNPWSLKYAGWLMAKTPLGKQDVKFIMDYANKFHMKATDLGNFCYNVALSKQPVVAKKIFIEKAHKVIQDPKQKGIAAIALAVTLSEMGDSAVNNARRLSLVKEAIIHAKDEKLGETNVGEISMELVHRLKNLNKGCVAPEISGIDSSGAQVNLAQHKGKVVMLVFWSSFDLPVEKTIELLSFMQTIEKQYAGKNFVLIGVNKDQIGNLRELEKGAKTTRINISDPQQKIFQQYRVASPPLCYVLDQQGRIQFTGIVGSFATLTVDALLSPAKPKAKAKDKVAPAKP